MKILVSAIIDVKKAAPNRLHHFIDYLSKKHEISIVCVNDTWKSQSVDMNLSYKDFHEKFRDINIKYITTKSTKPVIQELFSPYYLRRLNFNDYDIIFNYNTIISGKYLKKKSNVPMIFDIADDLPAMIHNSPQIPALLRGFGKSFAEIEINENIRLSSVVTSISDYYKEKFSIPNSKFRLIPNGVNTYHFRKKPKKSDIIDKYRLSGNFILGYVGVLREWVDLSPIYKAIKALNDVKLLVIGEEGLFKENQQLVKEIGVSDKVIFTGTIPYEEIPDYIACMDVCTIPFKINDITHNAVPLKLFEYMACEKPVISSDLRAVRDIAKNRIYYANTKEDYILLIDKLKKNETNPIILDNRVFTEMNFDWKNIGESLSTVIEGVF